MGIRGWDLGTWSGPPPAPAGWYNWTVTLTLASGNLTVAVPLRVSEPDREPAQGTPSDMPGDPEPLPRPACGPAPKGPTAVTSLPATATAGPFVAGARVQVWGRGANLTVATANPCRDAWSIEATNRLTRPDNTTVDPQSGCNDGTTCAGIPEGPPCFGGVLRTPRARRDPLANDRLGSPRRCQPAITFGTSRCGPIAHLRIRAPGEPEDGYVARFEVPFDVEPSPLR